MLQSVVSCGTRRQAGVLLGGLRLPRHIASQASARCLATVNTPLIRPHALRRDIPGSVRNLSLWSSKPTPPQEAVVTPPEVSSVEEQLDAVVPDIPEVPMVDVTSAPEATDALSDALASIPADTIASIPQMHYGDLAALGLASWWPSGIFQWGMEALHVSTGLPWFWTIVGATVFSRVILFPFAVQGMRNAAKLAPHQAEIQAMSEQMRTAFAKKDQFEQQRVQLKQMALYKKIGVNPASSLISPLVQIPVSLGMFFGVKHLCELPLEQLKWSGLSFLPDLTVPDSTWILPVLTVIAINTQLTVSARDMMANAMAPHIINVFRVMTVASLYLFGTWPAGMGVNVISGVVTLLLQSLVLRIPAVRRKLDLPIIVKGTGIQQASFKDTYKALRKWVLRKMEEGKAAQGSSSPKAKKIQMETRKRR